MTVRRIKTWPLRPDATEAARPEPWMDDAACAETGDIGFFPEDEPDIVLNIADTTKLCRTCPVREACLEYAISREYEDPHALAHGIWGGMTAHQRRNLIHQRKRAAA